MCIIYQRQPNVAIDFDTKFKPSVINNPHGFGLSVVEGDGKLYTIKELVDEPDPEELYKLVQEEYLDQQILLHLRYTTAGDTSIRNLHPFPVLEYSKDGVDLRMAHNGTIHKFKHKATSEMKWESDTRNFVRTYVRPLFKLLIKGNDIEELLSDPLVYGLLDEHLPNASVLAFIDGFGNTLEVNPLGNGGEYEGDGLWYSNKYSFNEKHRVPPSTPTYNHGYGGSYGSRSGQVWKDGKWTWLDDTNSPPNGTMHTGQGGSTNVSSRIYSIKDHAMDTKTPLFSEKYKEAIESVDDLFTISDETLLYLQEEEPEDLTLLCKELLYRCQGLSKGATVKAEKIKALEAELKKLKGVEDGKAA